MEINRLRPRASKFLSEVLKEVTFSRVVTVAINRLSIEMAGIVLEFIFDYGHRCVKFVALPSLSVSEVTIPVSSCSHARLRCIEVRGYFTLQVTPSRQGHQTGHAAAGERERGMGHSRWLRAARSLVTTVASRIVV